MDSLTLGCSLGSYLVERHLINPAETCALRSCDSVLTAKSRHLLDILLCALIYILQGLFREKKPQHLKIGINVLDLVNGCLFWSKSCLELRVQLLNSVCLAPKACWFPFICLLLFLSQQDMCSRVRNSTLFGSFSFKKKKKKSGSNLIFVMLLISKASQICTVEIGFVSDKRANRSKQVFQNLCLLKEMEMRKAWKQPNEWSSAVHTELCVSSWVAFLQTNTLSALYVLYKSSLSSNTRALYKKYPCVCWGMWLMWLPVGLEALH